MALGGFVLLGLAKITGSVTGKNYQTEEGH